MFVCLQFCLDEIKQEQVDEGFGGPMQKVPSMSDLSDTESSLGKSWLHFSHILSVLFYVLEEAHQISRETSLSRGMQGLGCALGDARDYPSYHRKNR